MLDWTTLANTTVSKTYRLFVNYYYLLLNRTEYSMKINKLRSQLARANVRNNVVQLVAR